MSDGREILIYPGSPKTGTTALQSVLRCSVEGLKAAGWNYLEDPLEGEPDALGSGNALPLLLALKGRGDLDPLVEFERLAPPGERSILVCEVLSEVQLHEWSPIIDLLEAEGGAIRSVFCVRDLYPYYWSAYNQRVSVWQLTDEFSVEWFPPRMTFAPERRLDDRYSFRLPDSPCVEPQALLHYETIKGNLVEEMLTAGRLPLEALDLEAASSLKRPLNRSLTQPEIALMRRINAQMESFPAWWAGKTLTERPIPRRVKPVYVPEVHQWLIDDMQETVDTFNAGLPPGTDWELKILDQSGYDFDPPDPQPEASPEYTEAIYHLLSFEPGEALIAYLVSLLPGGVYDPPPPPGLLRRAAGKVKRVLTPS